MGQVDAGARWDGMGWRYVFDQVMELPSDANAGVSGLLVAIGTVL